MKFMDLGINYDFFQFIVEYIVPKEKLPFGLDYCIRSKRIRAKNGKPLRYFSRGTRA